MSHVNNTWTGDVDGSKHVTILAAIGDYTSPRVARRLEHPLLRVAKTTYRASAAQRGSEAMARLGVSPREEVIQRGLFKTYGS